MVINKVRFTHFRNLQEISFQANPKFNLFYGNNAAGKTSVLEGIYYLGHARSFRTNISSKLIQYDVADRFVLHADLSEPDGLSTSIGIERSKEGARKIRVDRQEATGPEQLAELLPIRFINVDCYRYFHDGSKPRRQMLDWGVFHVEPKFFRCWSESQRMIKQRNAALKQKLPYKQIAVWDAAYIPLAEKIDLYRTEYLSQFEPVFMEIYQRLLGDVPVSLRYSRGWKKESDLREMLAQQFSRDMQLGYTQSSPHRADLKLQHNGIDVQDSFSQGQQKLAAYSLLLAQGVLLQRVTNISPIYLIDDMPSELDDKKQGLVCDILKSLDAQVFITGINQEDLLGLGSLVESTVFHVEQGRVE